MPNSGSGSVISKLWLKCIKLYKLLRHYIHNTMYNRNVLVACVCVRRRSNIKNEFIVSLMSDEKGHLTEVTVQREKHTKYFYIQNPLTLKRSHQYDSLPNRLTNPLPIFGQRVH